MAMQFPCKDQNSVRFRVEAPDLLPRSLAVVTSHSECEGKGSNPFGASIIDRQQGLIAVDEHQTMVGTTR